MNGSNAIRIASRMGRLVLWLALLISFGGCVVLPTNYYGTLSRNNISHETPSLLHPGSTTREDVFLLLGEPDFVLENGQRLGYRWSKVKWIYGDFSGGHLEFCTSFLLLVSFDGAGYVSDANTGKGSDAGLTPEQILQSGEDLSPVE